jgi:hypothetical protein
LALPLTFIIFRYKENKLNTLKTKDMPNMSYCRFRNTYLDLIDCSNNLNDKDLSFEEKMAKKNLLELCKEMIEDYEFNNLGELEHDWDDEDEEEE